MYITSQLKTNSDWYLNSAKGEILVNQLPRVPACAWRSDCDTEFLQLTEKYINSTGQRESSFLEVQTGQSRTKSSRAVQNQEKELPLCERKEDIPKASSCHLGTPWQTTSHSSPNCSASQESCRHQHFHQNLRILHLVTDAPQPLTDPSTYIKSRRVLFMDERWAGRTLRL